MRWYHDAGLPQEEAENACLVVIELATNALMHGNVGLPTVTLRKPYVTLGWSVVDGGEYVYIQVWDAALSLPKVTHAGTSDVTGRGLGIVDSLTNKWGAHPWHQGGKIVWAEMMEKAA